MLQLDPASILGSPCDMVFVPNNSLCCKIAIYLTNVYNKSFMHIQPLLPNVMPHWGRSHVAGSGDQVVMRWAQSWQVWFRDASFVWVSILLLLYLCLLKQLLISNSMKLQSIQILKYGAKPPSWNKYAMVNFTKSLFVKYHHPKLCIPSQPPPTSSCLCQTVKFTLMPLWLLLAMLSFPKQLRLSPSHQCHQFVDASLSTLLWVSMGHSWP